MNVIMATSGPISGFVVQPIIGTISDVYVFATLLIIVYLYP